MYKKKQIQYNSVLHFIVCLKLLYLVSVACKGGGGAQTPAPLRSDAKVPLRSGLCDMNDIVDDKNQYRRSLRRVPSPRGAPSQLLKKKQKKPMRHSRARDRSRLMFVAECR